MSKHYNVLLPGPSLKKKLEGVRLQGFTVVVNTAAMAPVDFDYWCCMDNPKKFAQAMPNDRIPVVICPERQERYWSMMQFRTIPFPNDETLFRKKYLPDVKMTVHLLNISATAAISVCIGRGAMTIDVYGCDLQGNGYSFGVDPQKRTPGEWTRRWQDEHKHMEKAKAEWAQTKARVSFL